MFTCIPTLDGLARAEPIVTVLMPVYNAAPYLLAAVNSVLAGSFADFELLAIDDGSTDESLKILTGISDPRLRVIQNPRNQGVIATLNRGLDLARGKYIARMDADDISMPDRLCAQVAFMDANPEIGMSGTWLRTFGASESTERPPTSASEIHMQLIAFNPICHPSVILRRELFEAHGLRYSSDARHAEDLSLWMRASNYFRIANIPIIGLRYRVHANQVSKRFEGEQQQTLARLQRGQLLALVADATEEEIQLHLKAVDLGKPLTHEELLAIGEWLRRLEDANQCVKRYEAKVFHSFIVQRWLNAAHRCSPQNMNVWQTWRASPFAAGILASPWLLGKSVVALGARLIEIGRRGLVARRHS